MRWRTLPAALSALILFLSTPLLAKPNFRVEGRINFELKSESRLTTADLDKEAVLALQTRRNGGFQGGLDTRISSDSGTVELREIFLEYQADAGSKLLIGQQSKLFGLDWEYSLEERIALNRGIVNDKLTQLSYVGRDTLLRFRPGQSEDSRWTHDISLHTANGLNAAMLYGAKWWLSPKTFLASTTLGQLDQLNERPDISAAQTLGFSRREGAFRLDTEFIVGNDHLESNYLKNAGTPRPVIFSALQAMTAIRLGRVEPFLRTAGVLNDLSSLSNRTLELTAGSRVYLVDQVYLGAQIQGRHFEYGGSTPSVSNAELLATLRYFF